MGLFPVLLPVYVTFGAAWALVFLLWKRRDEFCLSPSTRLPEESKLKTVKVGKDFDVASALCSPYQTKLLKGFQCQGAYYLLFNLPNSYG